MTPSPASRTRLSLFYVVAYLTTSGLGLLVAPAWTQRMLFASVEYDPTAMRFAGLFIVGLAMIVGQIVRLRIDALYTTLIAVRVAFCAVYIVLYVQTHNPFFLAVFGVVGLGLTASTISYALDRRRATG